MPTQALNLDFKHPGWPGFWSGTGHQGGGVRGICHDATHQDKDIHKIVLSEPDQIQGDLLGGAAVQGLGARGGVGLVTRKRPVGWGIDSTRYHRAERGKMRARHRTKPEPTHWRVPPSVDAVAPAQTRGGPEALQGLHCHRGPERLP